MSEERLFETLREFYADEPFVRVVDHLPGTKDSSGTNFCDITARVGARPRADDQLPRQSDQRRGRRRGAEFQFDVRLSPRRRRCCKRATDVCRPSSECEAFRHYRHVQADRLHQRAIADGIDSVPQGFRLGGVYCGLKRNPTLEDLSLVVSDRPATAAGVYTQNLVFAAPVALDRARTPARLSGRGHQLGQRQRLHRRARLSGRPRNGPAGGGGLRGRRAEQALVLSTGIIGEFLPMEKICGRHAGGRRAVGPRRSFAGRRRPRHADHRHGHKLAGRSLSLAGRTIQITGMAKGAAMIGPNMATMLGLVLTDAAARAGRRPAGSVGRRRRHVQLHQRRRPHEHQRHGAAVGQRRGRRRAAGRQPIWRRFKPRCMKFAASWPGRFRPTAKGPRTWSRSTSRGCATREAARQIAKTRGRKPAGENGHRRRRSQLGTDRFGRRLCGRAVRSGRSQLRVNGRCCTSTGRRRLSTRRPYRRRSAIIATRRSCWNSREGAARRPFLDHRPHGRIRAAERRLSHVALECVLHTSLRARAGLAIRSQIAKISSHGLRYRKSGAQRVSQDSNEAFRPQAWVVFFVFRTDTHHRGDEPRDGRNWGPTTPRSPTPMPAQVMNGERVKYWLSVGAQPSERVHTLIKKYGPDGTHVQQQQAALEKLKRPKPIPDCRPPALVLQPKKEKGHAARRSRTGPGRRSRSRTTAPASRAARRRVTPGELATVQFLCATGKRSLPVATEGPAGTGRLRLPVPLRGLATFLGSPRHARPFPPNAKSAVPLSPVVQERLSHAIQRPVLFPEILSGDLGQSLLNLASAAGLVDVRLHNIRDWAEEAPQWSTIARSAAGRA